MVEEDDELKKQRRMKNNRVGVEALNRGGWITKVEK